MNEVATVLRDQADRDCICARHLYLLGFADQFMWQGQQAIEKYLKAIILFQSALPHEGGTGIRPLTGKRGYGHKLPSLLKDVLRIEPWKPEMPASVGTFIAHLHRMGLNRYSDQHAYRLGDEMLRLDEAVWHIRRWCRHSLRRPLRGMPPSITPARMVDMERDAMQRLTPGNSQHITGLLESIIERRRGPWWRHARFALLRWNSWFFGTRRSAVAPPRWSSSSTPVWSRSWARHPEIAELFFELGVGPKP